MHLQPTLHTDADPLHVDEALLLQPSAQVRNPASCPVHSAPGTLLWAALSGNSSDPPPACLQELELIQMLVKEDQGHLFAAWPPCGETLICAHQTDCCTVAIP